MKKFTLVMAFALAIFISACGPSVEGQKEDWKENLADLEKIKTDHPAFASIIDAQLTTAKDSWKAAEAETNEDEQAKKMMAANDLLEKGCVGNLKNMKSKISSVSSKRDAVKRKKKKAKKGKVKATEAMSEASDAINYANKVMALSADELGEDPCGKINEAFKLLGDSYNDLSSAMSKMGSKSKKEKKDSKKKKEDDKK